MPRIDGSEALAALIRARLAAGRQAAPPRAGHGQAKAAEAGPQAAAPSAAPGDNAQGLSHALVQRIRALHPDDPQRRRKAFRLFLESVLLQELGAQLANDAGFDGLVEQVLQQMESDAELRAAVDEAAGLLLAAAGGDAAP